MIACPAGGPYPKVPPPRGLLLPRLPAVPRINGFGNEALFVAPTKGREACAICQGLRFRRWLRALERLLSPTAASTGPVRRAVIHAIEIRCSRNAKTRVRRTRECPQAAGLAAKYANCRHAVPGPSNSSTSEANRQAFAGDKVWPCRGFCRLETFERRDS